MPALAAPNDVLVLFSRVATAPATSPQSAIWHFGWHVTDARASLESYKSRPDVTLLPLYTTDEGGSVFVSSDTWPSAGRTPGLTKTQIAEAKTNGVQPTRTGGFAYMQGPDDALVEYAGNHPAERFNHVHMYQDDPFCAQLWYQTHLNAPIYGRGGEVAPPGGGRVTHGDVGTPVAAAGQVVDALRRERRNLRRVRRTAT